MTKIGGANHIHLDGHIQLAICVGNFMLLVTVLNWLINCVFHHL